MTISTPTRWIGRLAALLTSLPAVAAAAELADMSPSTDWSYLAVPAGLLLVIALSLGVMGYLVACQVAERLSAGPLRGR